MKIRKYRINICNMEIQIFITLMPRRRLFEKCWVKLEMASQTVCFEGLLYLSLKHLKTFRSGPLTNRFECDKGLKGLKMSAFSAPKCHFWPSLPKLIFPKQWIWKLFKNIILELALWSRGRVDGSQSEGPRFDPCVTLKLFYQILDESRRITS